MNCESIQIDFSQTNHIEKHVIFRNIEDIDDQMQLTLLMNKLLFSRPNPEPTHASIPNLDRIITFDSPISMDAFRIIYEHYLTQVDRNVMCDVINGATSNEVKGQTFKVWFTNPTYRFNFIITIGNLHVNPTPNTKKD